MKNRGFIMKTKSKLGLIFLCLLIFLTVAGVSASDVNEIDEFSANDAVSVDNADVAATPTVSDNNYNNELSSVDNSQSQLDLNENETNITDDKNGDVLSSKQDDDNLGASNAYEKVGNTITSTDTTFANLQKTINNAANGDIIVLTKDVSQGATSEIKIKKNITINGNGHILNANSKSYVFDIDYFYVKEFNLTNARVMNSYSQYSYGAISSTGGSETNKRTINIVNCTFSNCNSRAGSVFYVNYVNLALVNSTISNNQVTGTSTDYGCIYFRNGDATVINCNFTNNKGVDRTEGAVVGSYKSNFYFEDCLFKGNYAGYYGGALYFSSSNATFINCNFTGNNASYGCCWYAGRVLAKNCNFYENYQYNSSGHPSLIYSSITTLIDCNFYNNYLRGSYLVQLNSNSLVSNCNISNNSGVYYIFYADSATNASVCNSNFTKNNCSSGYTVYLGAGTYSGGNYSVINCIFHNNTAYRAITASNATIIGCNISGSDNNFSTGFLSVSVPRINTTSSVINCTFSDFYSTSLSSSVMAISGSYLDSKVDIIDCNIYNNTVGTSIRITSNNVNVTFTNCNIYNNTAPSGGAFNITNGNVFINNCKIYNNRATNTSGGAICIMNSANLILNNSNLTYNIANFTGGAIYSASTGSVTLTSCTIENNNASRGSAIYISANNVNSNRFTLENVRMLNNFANVTNILFNNYQNKRKFVFNTTFATWDNFLNGIYVAVDEAEYTDNIVVKNVTYYGEGGLVTTVDSEHSAIFGLETDPQYPTIHGGPNQNLTFKIYDGSDEIDSYQFATDLNGRVTFELSNLTADKNYTLKVIHYKDNYYGDYEKSTNFTVIKFIPTLVLNQSSVVYGDDVVVLIDDCWDAEGTMNLTYNSTSGPVTLSAPVINGTAVFSEDIPAAFYTLELWYSGDVNYPELNTTLDLEVTKIHPDFVIEAPEIGAGEEAVIFIYLPDGVTGTVFVNASDLYFATIDDVSSVRNVTLNGVPAFGRYTVNATYSGDERYYSASATCTLFVERLKSKLNISVNDVFVGEDVLINFSIVSPKNDSLLDTSSGKLRVFINGNMYNLDVVNGKSNLTISNLTMGNYSIIGLYDGDYYYSSTDSNSAFLVKGHDYAFNVSAENIREGSNATITVNLPDDATGIITIKVNDSIYALDLSKGHNLTVSGLATGNYVVIASYAGDTNYYENTNSTNFAVFSRIVSELSFDKPVFVVDVASVINVSSNFPAGELFVYVDGVKQDAGVIVSGGKAKIDLPGLSAGNHSVLVTFDGDYDYTNLTTSFDIFVEKYNSTVNVSASSVRTLMPAVMVVLILLFSMPVMS